MSCASTTFAVWASAWLAGSAAPDDVLDALAPWSEAHDVLAADDVTAATTGLPGPGSAPTSTAMLLAAVRRGAPRGQARLVLPAPGDVRGLPGPGPFSDAAITAGEGVLFADAGFGVVPSPIADGVVRWTAHAVADPGPVPEYVALNEAERELRGQVRAAAAALTDLGAARHRPGVREEIAAWLRRRPQALWPGGMPPQALRVLQQADEVDAILSAASGDEPGGALSASAAVARSDALRPIATAVRVARRAAVAEAVRVLVSVPR
ncbi:hypothetical protein [Pseudonocardia sp. ICBG162]|uniref:hypothetical protein n=1 Tax=Pseudonocardia sp. ICBG162 TaxID=2846761 RepID=UPI001CF6168B|nr:hypothetical protein [Pseudonocardia sp. ICBG162]